jgi:NAD(P)-dependent dehydrogenase (short-subunit alcohol dehydrogenase family)
VAYPEASQIPAGRLSGKICLITGARSGIGRATAIRFAAEGARVACVDVADPGDTVAEIRKEGGEAEGFAADVTSRTALEAVVVSVLGSWARIDAVYANAGIAGAGTAHELDEDHWHHVINVNLTGIWLTMRAVLPAMMEQRSGSIIVQGSVAALVGFEAAAPYAASKGGVIALARQAAVDYGEYGIRVNVIAPGMVPTQLLDDTIALRGGAAGVVGATRDAITARVADMTLLKRTGEPGEVADLALFLASDESRWITGATVVIDGGLTVR